MAKEFYILSLYWSQSNGVCTWWRPEGKGYTDDLNQAGLFTKESVEEISKCDKDIGIPKEVVEQLFIRRIVDLGNGNNHKLLEPFLNKPTPKTIKGRAEHGTYCVCGKPYTQPDFERNARFYNGTLACEDCYHRLAEDAHNNAEAERLASEPYDYSGQTKDSEIFF